MKVQYYWNKTLKGLPGAFIMIIKSLFMKVNDRLTTVLVRNNINSCGSGTKINSGITYRYPGNIKLGKNVSVARRVEFYSENAEAKLVIGDNSIITFDVRLDFSGNLTIGNGCVISKQTIIETHDHGLNPNSSPIYKSLEIGENVWIGMGCSILSNVRQIGENSIIASNSLVTKPVPPNHIVGGVPAKIIKKLSDEKG